MSQLKNQPLITYFVKFLQQTNSCINAILRDNNVIINPEDYVELRKGLKWYVRFERLGEMILINRSKKSKNSFINLEQISSLLKLHYKWLTKFLRKLYTIIRKYAICEKSESEVRLLLDTVNNLNDKLDLAYDPVKKISKRIKKHLTLPPPHSSETSMNVYTGLKKITRDLDTRNEEDNLKRELKIVFTQLEDVHKIVCETISLWKDVYSENSISSTTLETFLKLEKLCDVNHVSLRVPAEIDNVLHRFLQTKERTHLNSRIQLWPIYEYMFLSLAYSVQGEMCLEGDITDSTCIIQFFSDILHQAGVCNIPCNLIGLLSAITNRDVEQRRKMFLLPELFCHLAQFAQRSYAVKDSSLLLHWHGLTQEDVDKLSTSYTESKVCMHISFDGILFVDEY